MVDEVSLVGALEVLVDEELELILVGGLACVIQGAPFVTQDVAVVHRRTEANVDRVDRALERLNARVRGRPGPLRPSKAALLGPGHHLLMTDAGPLDLLGTIEQGADYGALVGDTVELEATPARPVKVLTVERILALKESSTHPKDRRTVSALQALLATRDGEAE
jgi:hypothetical protein